MSERKKYQERWNREYGWFVKLLGKGRKRYMLFGLYSHLIMSLLPLIGMLLMAENPALQSVMFTLFGFGLLLNFLITGLHRLRYWRDAFIFTLVATFPAMAEVYVTGFSLLRKNGQPDVLSLVIAGWLISIFFLIRQSEREAKRWEIARRTGFLKPYLDEGDWTFDDDILKYGTIYFDLVAAEDAFKKTEEQMLRLKWITRFEKLHYLIPGVAISLRRSLGQDEVIMAVLLITLGLVFLSGILNKFVLYIKVREWEKEKGKPILLREIWEKEQQQRS